MKYFFLSFLTLFVTLSSINAQFDCVDCNLPTSYTGDDSCEACKLRVHPPVVTESPFGLIVHINANIGLGGSAVDCRVIDSHFTYGDGTQGTNPGHVYSSPGLYEICHVVTVQQTGHPPCTEESCVEICVGCESSKTFLNGNSVASNVNIYPNPAKDIINIELENKVGNGNIIIMNAAGMILKSTAAVGSNMMMDISELPTGVYFLRTEDSEGNLVLKKFIKE